HLFDVSGLLRDGVECLGVGLGDTLGADVSVELGGLLVAGHGELRRSAFSGRRVFDGRSVGLESPTYVVRPIVPSSRAGPRSPRRRAGGDPPATASGRRPWPRSGSRAGRPETRSRGAPGPWRCRPRGGAAAGPAGPRPPPPCGSSP